MAKKVKSKTRDLTKKEQGELLEVGIKATTSAAARVKLVKYLKSQELDDIENDPLEDLIEFAKAYYEPEDEEEEEDMEELEEDEDLEELDEEDEYDILADEVEEDTEPDYEKMLVKDLRKMCIEKKLIKKNAAVNIRKKQPFLDLLNPPKKEKKAKEKPKAKATRGVSVEKFDGRGNEDHFEHVEALVAKIFPGKDFELKILKQGFTVRALLDNAKPTVINFDDLKFDADGELVGNLYFNKFKSEEDLIEFLPEKFHERKIGMFRGETHPSMKKVTEKEFKTLLSKKGSILSTTITRCKNEDGRLGTNRKNLEKSIEG